MSADDGGDGGPGRREVAWRVFAAEYDDADYSYSEGDQERAPNYVVTPTGARVNRLFAVGVLTAVESVSDDVIRARVVDPTGAFVVYAGQYQPDALATLERMEPPTFVAVTGKARTFQPDDSEVVYTSIRPESVNEVDAEARDRWVVRTAEHTLARASTFADALDRPERGDDLAAVLADAGVDDGLAAGVPRAIDHYGTTTGYLAALRDLALDATRVVAGEREEAGSLELAPDEGGDADLDLSFSLDEAGEEPAVGDAEAPDAGSVDDGPDEEAPDDTPEPTAADADAPATGPAESGTAESTDEETPVASTAGSADSGTDAVASDDGTASGVSDDGATADGSAGAEAVAAAGPSGDGDEGAAAGTDAGAVDPDEMYELDEEERAEIEEEFPTEFASGNEIPDAGEADIETPDSEEAPAGDEDAVPTDGTDESPGEPAVDEGAAGDLAESEPATESAGDAATDDEPAADETTGAEPAAEPTGAEPASDESADAEPTADSTDDESTDESPDDGSATDEVAEDLESVVVEYMQELDDGDGVDREALADAVTGDYAVDADDVEEAVQDALMSGRCFEPEDGVVQPI